MSASLTKITHGQPAVADALAMRRDHAARHEASSIPLEWRGLRRR